MLKNTDQDGTLKLIDFGSAKSVADLDRLNENVRLAEKTLTPHVHQSFRGPGLAGDPKNGIPTPNDYTNNTQIDVFGFRFSCVNYKDSQLFTEKLIANLRKFDFLKDLLDPTKTADKDLLTEKAEVLAVKLIAAQANFKLSEDQVNRLNNETDLCFAIISRWDISDRKILTESDRKSLTETDLKNLFAPPSEKASFVLDNHFKSPSAEKQPITARTPLLFCSPHTSNNRFIGTGLFAAGVVGLVLAVVLAKEIVLVAAILLLAIKLVSILAAALGVGLIKQNSPNRQSPTH